MTLMPNFIERFIKTHITGDDPEAMRDFIVTKKSEATQEQNPEIPDINIVEPIENPDQIKPMVQSEAQGTFIGLLTGVATTVLKRLANSPNEE
jgi:heat shock protein HslJ